MRILLVVVVLVLVGCTRPEGQVEDVVRKALKDPDSARFESVSVAGDGEARVACGLVNAKNPMGGYTGAKHFMLRGNRLWISDDATSLAVSICCSGHLMPDAAGSADALTACAAPMPEPLTIY